MVPGATRPLVGEADLLLRAAFLAQVVNDHDVGARLARAAEQAGGGWHRRARPC